MKIRKTFCAIFAVFLMLCFCGCEMGVNLLYYNNQNGFSGSAPGGDDFDDGDDTDDDGVDDGTDGGIPDLPPNIEVITEDDGNGYRILHRTTEEIIKIYPDSSKDVRVTVTEIKETLFDPFKESEANLPWNDPEYRFSANKTNDWVLKVIFGKNNIPSYSFFQKDNSWSPSTHTVTITPKDGTAYTFPNLPVFEHDGKDDGNRVEDPLSISINPATIRRFDGRNPLYEPKTSKEAEHTKRFRFYHLTGKASIQNLNQYLCVIDTYSKFVWAYVYITGTSSTMGQEVPETFDAIENYQAPRGVTRKQKRMFWEYDPIGFLDEHGNVTLYTEFESDMKSQTSIKFFPQVHDKNRGIASVVNGKDGAGCSPYYWAKVPDWYNPETEERIIDQYTKHVGADEDSGDHEVEPEVFLEKVKGMSFMYRPIEAYSYNTKLESTGGRKEIIEVTDGNGSTLYSWQFSADGKNITCKEKYLGEPEIETIWTFDESQKLSSATSAKYINGNTTATIEISSDEDGVIIKKDNQKMGVENYTDPGPDFILRVRAKTFTKSINDGKKTVSFQFSKDGGYVTVKNMDKFKVGTEDISGTGTYYFVEEKDGAKTQAIYEHFGVPEVISVGAFGSSAGSLSANPWYGLTLENGYTTIYRSKGVNNSEIPSFEVGDKASEICELSTEEIPPDQRMVNISITAKSMTNKNIVSAKISLFGSTTSMDTAYMINIMHYALYKTNEIPEYIQTAAGGRNDYYTTSETKNTAWNILPGSTVSDFKRSQDYEVPENISATIELDTKTWLYNIRSVIGDFVDTAGKIYKFADFCNPVKLVYDPIQKVIKFDSIEKKTIKPNGSTADSRINVDETWSINVGESKDFTIEYETNADKKNTKDNTGVAKCEVTYTISCEIVADE